MQGAMEPLKDRSGRDPLRGPGGGWAFRTLYGKLSAVLLLLFLLIGLLYVRLTLYTTHRHFQEVNQRLNRSLAASLLSGKTLMEEGRLQAPDLQELIGILNQINPGVEVYLLDSQGRILGASVSPEKIKRDHVSLRPIENLLGEREALPILGEDPRNIHHQKIFSAAPIAGKEGPQGYLYVVLRGEEFESAAKMLRGSYILRLSAWAAAGGLLFAFVTGLIVFNLLTRRLKRLSLAMDAFARSDYSAPVNLPARPEATGDEIDRLGETFSRMADRILQQLDTLKQTDTLRRELVANVSHDLRTPLASLQGYLETLLLKEGHLSEEEQRNYLEIAGRHCERLGKLVSELFELSKLDSHEAKPHREAFSLGELVQDVAQKFQLRAEQKRLRLENRFQEDPPFVFADIGMIARVLENLIENAIRHTPEKGKISIALSRQGTRVRVQVSDTGCGIAPEEIPNIFDRFYRVPQNSTDGKGAGLGLAITKRILELHQSSIEVESVPARGTLFTFYLPIFESSRP